MRVVLDTNVIISGLLKGNSNSGHIMRLVAQGILVVVYDARIISEYRDVLLREKFGFEPTLVEDVLAQIEAGRILAAAQPFL